MLELYIKLVAAGKRTLESVPKEFRAQVEAALNKTADNT